MPKTLWNDKSRRELLDRFDRLKPDAAPLWGRMNASQMVAHLVAWAKMANGELATAPLNRPLRYPLIKQIVIYWAPWPKGVPTAPELLSKDQRDFAGEHAVFRQYLATLRRPDSKKIWPEHPAFGTLNTAEWGALGYRHTDHHLRQFGV